MSGGPTTFVARHVHDLIERQRLDALPDRALLARFLADRDEAAFAALVRRHGPLVLGTCRRVLRHAQDAEDACQATFLVLARKGGTVRGAATLAGWLHRVAVRAAMRLKRDRARKAAEPLPADVGRPAATGEELVWREIRGAFDAEVGRLPERFRLPLLLCYLHGRTRAEAAAELGWTEGAVRGRLERGRKLLQTRFTRKGLTLPAALLSLLVEPCGPATASPVEAVPTAVAARLAEGVLKSMAVARAKLAAWATAAMLLVGTAVGLDVYGPASAQPKAGAGSSAAPEAPAPTVADAERNLDTFVLRMSLAPKGERKFDPKFSLYHVLLYVPNLRLEPPANGPDGKPTEAHARITKDQAKKIVAALAAFDFFEGPDAFKDPVKAKLQLMNARDWPHAGLAVRFQNGEDAVRHEHRLAWLPTMLPPLDAVRACVDGEAGKALDQLLGQLAEERKRWGFTLDEDLKKLQGTWAPDTTNKPVRFGGISSIKTTMKCVIDGKAITLKPQVQLDPLLDLESIKGTFELGAGPPRTMTIKGTQDTVSKVEPGTWTVLYEVTGDKLTLLFPPSGKAPPADGKPRWEQGDRQFILKRVPAGVASEWGEKSNGVQVRLRTGKVTYRAGEAPAFDIDVRADAIKTVEPEPEWHWTATRDSLFVSVEVDGVWYAVPPKDYYRSLAWAKLAHGQAVDRWASITLSGADWFTTDGASKPLALKPGKHKVRVKYLFFASTDGRPRADPISGRLDIEVLPAAGTEPAAADDAWKAVKVWKPHGELPFRHAAFAPDGKTLGTAADAELILWDVSGAEPKETRKVKLEPGVRFLGFDRKGTPLLVREVDRSRSREKGIDLVVYRPDDLDRDGLTRVVHVNGERVWDRAVSPDGRTLAVLADGRYPVRMFDLGSDRKWDLDAPKGTAGAYAFPRRVLFAPDGKLVVGLGWTDYPVIGKINGSVTVWSAGTGRVLWHKEEPGAQRWVSLAADGRSLVTAESLTHQVHVWDLATGAKRETFTIRDCRAAALSTDGRLLAAGLETEGGRGPSFVTVIDLVAKARIMTGPTGGRVEWVEFQPRGRALVTRDAAGELKWWVPGEK